MRLEPDTSAQSAGPSLRQTAWLRCFRLVLRVTVVAPTLILGSLVLERLPLVADVPVAYLAMGAIIAAIYATLVEATLDHDIPFLGALPTFRPRLIWFYCKHKASVLGARLYESVVGTALALGAIFILGWYTLRTSPVSSVAHSLHSPWRAATLTAIVIGSGAIGCLWRLSLGNSLRAWAIGTRARLSDVLSTIAAAAMMIAILHQAATLGAGIPAMCAAAVGGIAGAMRRARIYRVAQEYRHLFLAMAAAGNDGPYGDVKEMMRDPNKLDTALKLLRARGHEESPVEYTICYLRIHLTKGNFLGVVKCVEKHWDHFVQLDSSRIFYLIALAYINIGSLERARTVLNDELRSIRLSGAANSSRAVAYLEMLLGETLIGMGRYRDAVTALARALAADDSCVLARRGLVLAGSLAALVDHDQRYLQMARRELDTLYVRLDQSGLADLIGPYVLFKSVRALHRAATGEAKRSIGNLKRCIRKDPSYGLTYAFLGLALSQAGKPMSARISYYRALFCERSERTLAARLAATQLEGELPDQIVSWPAQHEAIWKKLETLRRRLRTSWAGKETHPDPGEVEILTGTFD